MEHGSRVAETELLTAPKLPMRHVDSSVTVMDDLTFDESQLKVSNLISLPVDILLRVCDDCTLADLLALMGSCRLLSLLDEASGLWRSMIDQRHAEVIRILFDGAVPTPPPGRSWKRHAFEFDREWLDLARQRSGRVLLRMSSDCTLSCPGYLGVPPSRRNSVRFHIRVPYFGIVLPVRLDLPNLSSAASGYGIFDATPFVDRHPGADQILLAATTQDDCTQGFDAANHSERARTILRRLVVPGLEELTEPPPLARPRPWKLVQAWNALLGNVRALRAMLRALPVTLWQVTIAARAVPPAAAGGGRLAQLVGLGATRQRSQLDPSAHAKRCQ